MRLFKMSVLIALAGALAQTVTAASSTTNAPQLISVVKIWDAGNHNAFTDLIRFKDKWFCTFRESQAHVGGNGKIRVITSDDAEHWQSAALLTEDGIDLRDPKFSITPDNRLMLTLGGSIYEGKKLMERQPRVTFSADGTNWTKPERVLKKNDWLWRVTWHDGHAYGIPYNSSASSDWTVKLVESTDGLTWKELTTFKVPGHPNESTLRFLENGDAVALVRREAQDKVAWIGTSAAPYKDWKWHAAEIQVGGPNFLVLKENKMIVSGRQYGATSKDAKTFVGTMDLQSIDPQLILPSGGDCSYPGMVWHEGLLWLSYYSSHEGKTSIYFAKIKFAEPK